MAVTEIGRRSPGPVTIEALGTGVIVAVLQVRGTFCRAREKLTSLAITGPSSIEHNLYNQNGIPSGPGDVDLTLPSIVINSSSLNGLNKAESLSLRKRAAEILKFILRVMWVRGYLSKVSIQIICRQGQPGAVNVVIGCPVGPVTGVTQ